MPILAVVGIAETGEREVLAFSVGDRENEQAWKDLLEDLKERGVKEIGLWVSDGNQAMLNAITKQFPTSARQRCVVHKMDNVLSYIPNKQQEQIKPELKALFYQKDRQAADQAAAAFIEKYRSIYPTAIACLQRDLEACLTFYSFPQGALEDDPHQQCHGAPFRGSQAPFAQDGGGFSNGRELFVALLCGYSQPEVQQIDDVSCISGSTRPCSFTQ